MGIASETNTPDDKHGTKGTNIVAKDFQNKGKLFNNSISAITSIFQDI
jgi:hypothetical protein